MSPDCEGSFCRRKQIMMYPGGGGGGGRLAHGGGKSLYKTTEAGNQGRQLGRRPLDTDRGGTSDRDTGGCTCGSGGSSCTATDGITCAVFF